MPTRDQSSGLLSAAALCAGDLKSRPNKPPTQGDLDSGLGGLTIDPRDALITELKKRLAFYERSNEFENDLCRLHWKPADPQEYDQSLYQAQHNLPLLVEARSLAVGDGDRPNLLIEGDNYPALLELSYTHAGQFDVIYIDPPYNTRTDSKPYDDNWDHSIWLSRMEPRLRLAQRLLADDGFMAVSIDDHELPRLVLLLEQIFGEGSTKVVAVRSAEPTGPKMAQVKALGIIPKLKEYVVFVRNGGVRGLKFDLVPKGEWDTEYNQFLDGLTSEGRAAIDALLARVEGDDPQPPTDEDLEQIEDEVLAQIRIVGIGEAARREGINASDPLQDAAFVKWRDDNDWRIVQFASGIRHLADRRAALRPDRALHAVRSPEGKFYITRPGFARAKVLFADLYHEVHPGDFWDIPAQGLDNEGGVTLKNGKKPLALLERIIKARDKTDALVLDFFAGSGTTGEAVLDLNDKDGGSRRFVLVTNNEPETDNARQPTGRFICHDITYPRLTGKFILGDRLSEYRAVEKSGARSAAAQGASKLEPGGALGRYGGSLRFFVADHPDHVVHAAEMVPQDRSALRVADLASDTLRLATDCYQSIPADTAEFEMWGSAGAILAILHRYSAREALVSLLTTEAKERRIFIYPSLPGGAPSEAWFRNRLGDRVSVSKLPDPILDNWRSRVAEARER